MRFTAFYELSEGYYFWRKGCFHRCLKISYNTASFMASPVDNTEVLPEDEEVFVDPLACDFCTEPLGYLS